MSGPGPNIPWLTDVLAKTGNYAHRPNIVPEILFSDPVVVPETSVTITVSIPKLNGIAQEPLLCFAWMATGLDQVVEAFNSISVTPSVTLSLGQSAEVNLFIISDGSEFAFEPGGEITDGYLFIVPVSSGRVFQSGSFDFAPPEGP